MGETKKIQSKYVKIRFESESEESDSNIEESDSDEYKEIDLADYLPKEKIESVAEEDMDESRKSGIEAIKSLLDEVFSGTDLEIEKASIKIENILFEKISKSDLILETYKKCIYTFVGKVLLSCQTEPSKTDIKKNLKNIIIQAQNLKFGWDNNIFDRVRSMQTEQDNFIIYPPEVEEGILTCRCGSKRTYSSGKQTASGDESTTIFCKCADCGRKWIER